MQYQLSVKYRCHHGIDSVPPEESLAFPQYFLRPDQIVTMHLIVSIIGFP